MTTKTEIQALLRFLSQDAKVPLPQAMSKIKDLQQAHLTNPESLACVSVTKIQSIFLDEKQSKVILAAAKRVSKKRAAGHDISPASKRSKASAQSGNPFLSSDSLSPVAIEASLALPTSTVQPSELAQIVLHTNRAPLVLAFAVTLLKYTMPSQPLSSRLSLAQAVVSANSRSKAVSLGLEQGKSAEEEGWGDGQPRVKIMGREIRVLKRWGYDWRSDPSQDQDQRRKIATENKPDAANNEIESDVSTQSTLKHEDSTTDTHLSDQFDPNEEPALWGLDLEAMRSSSSSNSLASKTPNGNAFSIHTAQSARTYLLKSFSSSSTSTTTTSSTAPPEEKNQQSLSKPQPSTSTKVKPLPLAKQREDNLAHLLAALDILFASYAPPVLAADELDRRAWGWYVAVRPEVANGVGGWGGKGEVRLAEILDLAKKSET